MAWHYRRIRVWRRRGLRRWAAMPIAIDEHGIELEPTHRARSLVFRGFTRDHALRRARSWALLENRRRKMAERAVVGEEPVYDLGPTPQTP